MKRAVKVKRMDSRKSNLAKIRGMEMMMKKKKSPKRKITKMINLILYYLLFRSLSKN